ncbi:hypothetical protein WDZ92_07950, partial [Nostoc sp. NIES-2111]
YDSNIFMNKNDPMSGRLLESQVECSRAACSLLLFYPFCFTVRPFFTSRLRRVLENLSENRKNERPFNPYSFAPSARCSKVTMSPSASTGA